ncbi:hypothetical protein I4U23_021902 [Adineta vaga]|nr:hypothetical protein I4U23_021902 [Adineta vaga]
MAHKDHSVNVQWMWQSNPNPFLPSEREEWSNYSKESSKIIEKAYTNREYYVSLSGYIVDLRESIQINKNNPTRRRPIKRVEFSKELSLQLKEKLGKGAFGTVYKGTYYAFEIACKVIDSQLSKVTTKETNILKTLHHPNIVRYIDVIYTSKQTFVVMEYIDGGTLYNYIKQTSYSNGYWINTHKMMINIAYAMSYLHGKHIVHADLKSDNILLKSNNVAVLSDFGLSKIIKETAILSSSGNTGAIRWLSPELCANNRERSSYMSDVWAYGCVLLEIITKKVPWEDMFENMYDLMDALAREKNANIFEKFCYNQNAPDNFHKMLRSCCAWSRNNRPNFVKIIKDFHEYTNTTNYTPIQHDMTFHKPTVSHFQRQPSAHTRPQTSSRRNYYQEKSYRSSKILYDSEEDDTPHARYPRTTSHYIFSRKTYDDDDDDEEEEEEEDDVY